MMSQTKIERPWSEKAIELVDQLISIKKSDLHGVYWEYQYFDAYLNKKEKISETINTGVSGVILNLIAVFRINPKSQYYETIIDASNWLIHYCKSTKTKNYSLCYGRMGSVYTLLQAYHLTSIEKYKVEALNLAQGCESYLGSNPNESFEDGTLGTLFVLIQLHKSTSSIGLIPLLTKYLEFFHTCQALSIGCDVSKADLDETIRVQYVYGLLLGNYYTLPLLDFVKNREEMHQSISEIDLSVPFVNSFKSILSVDMCQPIDYTRYIVYDPPKLSTQDMFLPCASSHLTTDMIYGVFVFLYIDNPQNLRENFLYDPDGKNQSSSSLRYKLSCNVELNQIVKNTFPVTNQMIQSYNTSLYYDWLDRNSHMNRDGFLLELPSVVSDEYLDKSNQLFESELEVHTLNSIFNKQKHYLNVKTNVSNRNNLVLCKFMNSKNADSLRVERCKHSVLGIPYDEKQSQKEVCQNIRILFCDGEGGIQEYELTALELVIFNVLSEKQLPFKLLVIDVVELFNWKSQTEKKSVSLVVVQQLRKMISIGVLVLSLHEDW